MGKRGKLRPKERSYIGQMGGGGGMLKRGDLPCQVLTEILTIFLYTDIKIFKMCLF